MELFTKSAYSNYSKSFNENLDLWQLKTLSPPFINIIANFQAHFNEQQDITNVLNRIITTHVRNIETMPCLSDIHLLLLLLPKNSTLRFLQQFDSYYGENLKIYFCSKTNPINCHSKLKPEILYRTQSNLAGFQQPGLIFQRNQLHFVSCHKEQTYWLNQLKELFTVFDLPTWLLLIFCLLLANIINYVKNLRRRISFTNTCFNLFHSILEQGSFLLQSQSLKKNLAFFYSFFFIPITIVLLSNLYKDDNITRLIMGPSLVPFDTFNSLIKYHFSTNVRRIHLTKYDVKFTPLEYQTSYNQMNGLEALPIVSEFWYLLLLVLGNP